jgi:hypothetical protein
VKHPTEIPAPHFRDTFSKITDRADERCCHQRLGDFYMDGIGSSSNNITFTIGVMSGSLLSPRLLPLSLLLLSKHSRLPQV